MTSISGTYFSTVVLSDPATQNPFTLTSTALVSVPGTSSTTRGVLGTAGYPWTLVNHGTILATGSPQAATPQPIIPIIVSHVGVELQSGGMVINGQSGGSGGLISGARYGVVITRYSGTVINYGTIIGGNDGVDLAGSGANTVINSGSIGGGGPGAAGQRPGSPPGSAPGGAALPPIGSSPLEPDRVMYPERGKRFEASADM